MKSMNQVCAMTSVPCGCPCTRVTACECEWEPRPQQEQEGRVTYSQCGPAQAPLPLPLSPPLPQPLPRLTADFLSPPPHGAVPAEEVQEGTPLPLHASRTPPLSLAPCLTPATFPWAGDTVGKVGPGCRLPPGAPAHTIRGCGDETLQGPPAGRWGRPAPRLSAERMVREGAGLGRRVLRSTRTLWTTKGQVEKSRGGETGRAPPPCPG